MCERRETSTRGLPPKMPYRPYRSTFKMWLKSHRQPADTLSLPSRFAQGLCPSWDDSERVERWSYTSRLATVGLGVTQPGSAQLGSAWYSLARRSAGMVGLGKARMGRCSVKPVPASYVTKVTTRQGAVRCGTAWQGLAWPGLAGRSLAKQGNDAIIN